jgi:hypothetical protein
MTVKRKSTANNAMDFLFTLEIDKTDFHIPSAPATASIYD